jgi:hypothetical protein
MTWGALSLTRGRVCSLQLLLGLATRVSLGSESHETHDYILLSQTWDSPNWRACFPPGTGYPSYTPRRWISGSLTHLVLVITSRQGPSRKRIFCYGCILSLAWTHLFLWRYFLVVAVLYLLVSWSLPSKGSTCHTVIHIGITVSNLD